MVIDIGRRRFISALSGAAAVWPFGARAQQAAMPVVGFVNGQNPTVFARYVEAFRQGLSDTGYTEGQNVAIEYAWAEGQDNQMLALVDDMVRRRVTVLVISGSGRGPLAAKTTPATLPVVVAMGSDPVELGVVASLNRPGGHITGTMALTSTMEAKRLDLLHQLLPKAELIAAVVDPTFPGLAQQVAGLQSAAAARGLHINIYQASTEADLDTAFAALSDAKANAVLLVGNPFFNSRRGQLVGLSARYAIPSMFEVRQFPEAGGLVSYGPSIADIYKQLGIYAGRILKGESAGDLPVVQPSKFDLVINLKTAKTLGIEIPPTLLALADDVIE
jgi:putative ABC transport system substrate-binding protein